MEIVGKVKVISTVGLVVSGTLLVGTMAYGFGFSNLLERKVCYVLANVNPELGKIGELDVFKKKPLCYNPSGVKDIDEYLNRANIVTGNIRVTHALLPAISKNMKKLSNGTSTEKAASIVEGMAKQAIRNGKKLVEENSEIIKKAKEELSTKSPIERTKVLQAISQTGQNLGTSMDEVDKDLPVLENYLSRVPNQ